MTLCTLYSRESWISILFSGRSSTLPFPKPDKAFWRTSTMTRLKINGDTSRMWWELLTNHNSIWSMRMQMFDDWCMILWYSISQQTVPKCIKGRRLNKWLRIRWWLGFGNHNGALKTVGECGTERYINERHEAHPVRVYACCTTCEEWRTQVDLKLMKLM